MNESLGGNNTKTQSSVRLDWENLICNIIMQLPPTKLGFFHYCYLFFEEIMDSHEVVRKEEKSHVLFP